MVLNFLIVVCGLLTTIGLAVVVAIWLSPYIEMINHFFSDERNDL